jgi:thiol-disulfide isomerase/thioredoxin
MGRLIRSLAALAGAALVGLTACATGSDAVARGGEFRFVSRAVRRRSSTTRRVPAAEFRTSAGRASLSRASRSVCRTIAARSWCSTPRGSWCGPCRHEMPELQKVYDQTKGSGVQLLGIDVRDEVRSAPADFVRDTGITYPSIYDPPGRSLLALNGYPRSVVPSTIVLDRARPGASGGRGIPHRAARGRPVACRATDRRRTADISGRALVNLTDLAVSGPLLLAGLPAITAGAVSFASPCCLPLVPGYLAYLAGLVGATPPPVSTVDGRPSGSAVGGEWRALLPRCAAGRSCWCCSSSDSPWSSPPRRWRCSGSPMPCWSTSSCCNASVVSSPS